MNFQNLKERTPLSLAILSAIILIACGLISTPYTNLLFSLSLFLLFTAWLSANLLKLKTIESVQEKKHVKKTMLAMSLCVCLGLLMLTYYEIQIPKYNVAKIKKELYRIPPQLSKGQLIELGRECNTFGNTHCSHDVFAKIVSMDPRDYYSLANLAMAQSHLGFHNYAVINFERAIANGIKTYDIFKFYGNSLLNLKKKELAIKFYKKSLELNPNQKSLHNKILKISSTPE